MIFNKHVVRLVLTTIGVIGVPLTSWLSVKCHEKAKDEETTEGKIKHYIPAAVSGVATVASIIGSHRVSSKEIAALTATATFAVTNRDKLSEAVKTYIKKEDVKQIAADSTHTGQCIEATGYGNVKFLDAYSGRLFYSSLEAVKKAEDKLNKMLNNGEYINLNDFYSFLNIEQTDFGFERGWAPTDDWFPRWYENNAIGFDNTIVNDKEGKPMMLISMEMTPMECYYEV